MRNYFCCLQNIYYKRHCNSRLSKRKEERIGESEKERKQKKRTELGSISIKRNVNNKVESECKRRGMEKVKKNKNIKSHCRREHILPPTTAGV